MTAEAETLEHQGESPNGMTPQEFFDRSVKILESFFGAEESVSYVASIREQQGNQEAMSSIMLGIALELSADKQQRFIDVMTQTLESYDETA